MTSGVRGRGAVVRSLLPVIVVLLVLAGAGARPPGARAATSPIAVHSMLQLNDPPSFMQAMFAQAAGLHAGYIRMDVAPSIVFQSPNGPPDFSGLDEVMALSLEYDLPVVADLYTIPSWIADCPTPTDPGDAVRCGTDDLADYASMVGQIVAQADPVIRDWEIWNEPDTTQFFTGSPAQYAHMLRTAYDTIKGIDPQDQVLLGGMSATSAMPWLAQVFATPGADAAGAFDIANIHERGTLDTLAGDVEKWRLFLAGAGFMGPLWVTEHGYPSDPAYQDDPSFTGGDAAQAAYLEASIPTLLDAGADEVFVTERDNLAGPFASEGLLGGDVLDPPVADPAVVEKPAYAAVAAMSMCYLSLGRDCPGPEPGVAPAGLGLPPTWLGDSALATATVTDAGPGPVALGPASLTTPAAPGLSITRDGCSSAILEPDHPCTVSVEFRPPVGGAVASAVRIPIVGTGNAVTIPVAAVAPSVSSLSAPGLPAPAFRPTGRADGAGYSQRLSLALTNPLPAPVRVAGAAVSGPDARQFAVSSDSCAPVTVPAGGGCRLSVRFNPGHAGTSRAVLRLFGDGDPLTVDLRATALALPVITDVAWPAGAGIASPGVAPPRSSS